MYTATANAVALISWQATKLLSGNFADTGSVWLLIGVIVAVVAIFALAMQAALFLDAPQRLKCRVRWPGDTPESTVAGASSRTYSDESHNVT